MNCSLLGLVGLLTALLFWLMRHARELNWIGRKRIFFAHLLTRDHFVCIPVWLWDGCCWLLKKMHFYPTSLVYKYIKCDEQCRTTFVLLIYSFFQLVHQIARWFDTQLTHKRLPCLDTVPIIIIIISEEIWGDPSSSS